MAQEAHVPMEDMEMFRRYVEVADWAWKVGNSWPSFARDTLGKQLVRAADSVGANLVEGDGRYTLADGLHFLVTARASARETRYWIQRATERGLIPTEEGQQHIAILVSATQMLNRLIAYRRKQAQPEYIKETTELYLTNTNDPFTQTPEHLNT